MHLTGPNFIFSRRPKHVSLDTYAMPAGMARRVGRRRFLALSSVLAFSALLAACGDSDDEKPAASATQRTVQNVTFMAGFKAQANLPFVGVYVAQEKGFFREQALNVNIRHAQSGEHLQLLLAGEVQFSTANGAQVIQRSEQNLPIISIAMVGQKSEQGYAVLERSNIRSVKDWEGKTFGYKGTVPVEFLAIAKANGLDPAKVRQVRVGFDPRILTEGQVDILAVFFSNEPDTLDSLGFKTRVFDPTEYGIQSPGLTYVTNHDVIAKAPDVVQGFTKAAMKGLEYAIQNRNEALDIVMKYAPQEDREHQRYMMNTEMDRAMTDLTRKNGIGWQTREQWQGFMDTLLEYKAIQKPVDLNTVFNDQFIRNTYKDGKLVWP
ncbi:MAG TPA: ABC transporter substrate-binding protein [Dehalococcoidia bacterium]|nr:ABC transporter substrate-binding protein [Dehalococcoidia bacterium]